MGQFGAYEGSWGAPTTCMRRPWFLRVLFFLLFSFSECFWVRFWNFSNNSLFYFHFSEFWPNVNASIQRGLLRYVFSSSDNDISNNFSYICYASLSANLWQLFRLLHFRSNQTSHTFRHTLNLRSQTSCTVWKTESFTHIWKYSIVRKNN